jgi:aspartate/methionine/tyrosine aminotransferase
MSGRIPHILKTPEKTSILMPEYGPQAEELNTLLKPEIYGMLSERGKRIYFPKKGILGQTAEAKATKINATIGIAVEDDGSPMRLKAISSKIKLDPEQVFPYAPSAGLPELRKAWKEQIRKKNPSLKSEISVPVVTCALTHALSVAGFLFLDPGDRVIMPDHYWGNYTLIFSHTYQAKIETFPTFSGNGFNIAGLKEKLKPGKQILLLNFPNNPTGYTPTDDEMRQIADAIKEAADKGNRLIVLLDDAYFGLVYKKGVATESLFPQIADSSERVITVKADAATKEDYVWGLRVGYLTFGVKGAAAQAYAALEAKAAGAIRATVSNAPLLSQSLVLQALKDPAYEKQKAQKMGILRQRFLVVEKTLKAHAEYIEHFKALPYNSGYFMCVQLAQGIDADKVRRILLETYDTGVIALGTVIRIAFSSVKKEDIPVLFENLYKACQDSFK